MPVIASKGHEIDVFRFKIYSIERDDYVLSRRLATRATVAELNGVTTGNSILVPIDDVTDGLTAIDYTPNNQ